MITDIIKQARELLDINCGEVTVNGQLVTANHLKMLNFMQRNLAAILDEVESCNLAGEKRTKELLEVIAENNRLKTSLIKLRDCDWEIMLPDRMDAVREIAHKALEEDK